MTSVLLFTLLLCGFGLEVNARCPSNSADFCASCPPGFTWYSGRCYLFREQEMEWAEAEKACNEFNGNLASIHRQDEYNFISKLIYKEAGSYKSTWVGGYDAVKVGLWFWSDGSRFDFSNWSPGEPNNQGGNEKCMQINLGGREYVNDANCDIKLQYVCSKAQIS
ncbi:galactose-specific lectin nattectin isoform X1 [Fundulus heteroclitus]|uniref:galactose-specific lectin nattectin isoform X1 n=1 Tax=Fundulus heteroclitus TaxID=8078 RepID=UPI00165AA3AF|nr:galactose-specific lectin nattectin isoform X1 [Fundulus heteroclitus]